MPGFSQLPLSPSPALYFSIATVLVVVALTAGAVGAASPGEQTSTLVHSQSEIAPDTAESGHSVSIDSNTTFTIELQTNGDAHWTVTERFNLSTDEQQQVFDEVAADFEDESADGSSMGYESFQQAGELVDADADRSVTVLDDQRSSSVDGDTGELTLTFTWENFARSENNTLVLDDVYETEHGLWFDGLAPGQDLTIKSPDGFGFDDANVVPAGGKLHWEGPETFTNETLQAVLIGVGDLNGVNGENNGTNGGETPGGANGNDGIGSSLGLAVLAIGGVGAVGAVIALAVLVVGKDRVRSLFARDSSPDTADSTDDTAGSALATEQPSEMTDSGEDADLELLSDEERVERLLEQNGGRMKQATIVKETGWSNAKVSQLLSSMDEEDRINKLRIGRENLISFPDEDITELGDK